MRNGYARVSTADQDNAVQRAAVLELVAEGRGDTEIAKAAGLSRAAVIRIRAEPGKAEETVRRWEAWKPAREKRRWV